MSVSCSNSLVAVCGLPVEGITLRTMAKDGDDCLMLQQVTSHGDVIQVDE